MTTIDLTPTRSESARIIAYVLSSHLNGNPSTVVNPDGDYWHFTDHEETVLLTAWQSLDAISTSLESIGIDLWTMTKTIRQRIIRQAINTANTPTN